MKSICYDIFFMTINPKSFKKSPLANKKFQVRGGENHFYNSPKFRKIKK